MFKKIILTISLVFTLAAVNAQKPVTWSFTAKKIADKTYELHLTPEVKSPWHIYSQTSPEGGGSPTKISFNKNPLATKQGSTKELGDVISKYEEVFNATVKYFPGKVDFVQVVKLKANVKTLITGTVEYMACTDEQCIPPATEKFSITLE